MKKNHVTLIVTATIAFTLAVFALTVWASVSKNDKKSDMKGNSSKPDVPSVSDPRDLILENDSELLDLKQLSREQLIDLLGERDEDGYRQLNSDFSKWDNMDYFAAANYCDIYKTETRTVIFEFADLRRSCTVEEQVDGDLQIRTIYNTRQFRCDIDPELSLSEEGNTALTGVLPDPVFAEFEMDAKGERVVRCPAGHEPLGTTYYEKQGICRARFAKDHCCSCPHRDKCRALEQKKNYVVMVSAKKVARAQYLKKLSTESYRQLTRQRNAIEGIPSVLRRKYRIDEMPVFGYIRSKMFFVLKLGAYNIQKLCRHCARSRRQSALLAGIA